MKRITKNFSFWQCFIQGRGGGAGAGISLPSNLIIVFATCTRFMVFMAILQGRYTEMYIIVGSVRVRSYYTQRDVALTFSTLCIAYTGPLWAATVFFRVEPSQ